MREGGKGAEETRNYDGEDSVGTTWGGWGGWGRREGARKFLDETYRRELTPKRDAYSQSLPLWIYKITNFATS